MKEGKIKIFCGFISTGERHAGQEYAIREIVKRYGDKIELVYPQNFVGRIFHDFARNASVEEFLASDCDVLWFLDADIVPPVKVMELVTEHWDKWQLAGAPYPVFMGLPGQDGPVIVFTTYKKGQQGFHAASIPDSGTDFVDGIATGCIFIKRGVFTKLRKPYFEFKYNPETREMIEGEDLGFCRKVNDVGYQFFTDYSMVCKHYKRVCLLDVNNYAIRYANNAINAFDAHMRSFYAQKLLERTPTKAQRKLP